MSKNPVLIQADQKFWLTLVAIRLSLKLVAMVWGKISRIVHVLFCCRWSSEKSSRTVSVCAARRRKDCTASEVNTPPESKLILFFVALNSKKLLFFVVCFKLH